MEQFNNLKSSLFSRLAVVEKTAESGKWYRFFKHPYKYVFAIGFRMIYYRLFHSSLLRQTSTFFGEKIFISLPAATDIYLTEGKSHVSEIRLAKLMIHYLQQGNTFMDIGAHFGFFSKLAKKLVGDFGQVHAFEPTPDTFKILSLNKGSQTNFFIYNNLVSDTNTSIAFYTFPEMYSEYNSTDVSQFENEKWFSKYPPEKIHVTAVIPDHFFDLKSFKPNMIKIDVEGSELHVIQGMKDLLQASSPLIVMEYLSENRSNLAHQAATKLLKSYGYLSGVINNHGQIEEVDDIDNYLKLSQLDSDNIVFYKTNKPHF